MKKKIIIKVLASVILIGILLYSINLDDFIDSIKNARLLFLILGFCTTIPGILISTYKWQLLLNKQKINNVPFLRLWMLYHIGMFFNNFLPTEVGGDIVRSYNVGKYARKQAESFAAVTMERITGLMAVVIYGIIGVFINWSLASDLQLTNIGFGCFFITALFIILIFNHNFARWIKKKMEIAPIKKIISKLKSFYLALSIYKDDIALLIYTIFISIIFQFFAILNVYFFLLALKLDVSFLQLTLIVPMITLISVIPIGINGIGVRESAFVFLFAQIGVMAALSFAVSIFYRITTLIPSVLGGIFYALSGNSVEKVKKDANILQENSLKQSNL